jgi:hypothetical protein
MAADLPDWTVSQSPYFATLGAHQSQVTVVVETTVPAGSTISATLYTIPAAKIGWLCFIAASFSKSSIHYGHVLKNGVAVGAQYLDIFSVFNLPPAAALKFVAGDAFGYDTTNTDTVDHDVKATFTLLLEDA